jgi:hypothetical protein
LVLGSLAKEKGFWWGAAAGGIGSALADILGGYAMFAPVTLIAKGIEGGLAALAAKQVRVQHFVFLALGGAFMVAAKFRAGCGTSAVRSLLRRGTMDKTTQGNAASAEESASHCNLTGRPSSRASRSKTPAAAAASGNRSGRRTV